MTYTVHLDFPADFEGWRLAARRFLMAGVAPDRIAWRVAGGEGADLFETQAALPEPLPGAAAPTVPGSFLVLARKLICHSDPARFDLAYRLLLRFQTEPHLLSIRSDFDVHRAHHFERAVSRDMHKMRAFLRFREAHDETGEIFLAWFEPSHHILDATAPFFVRRFANQRWAILTPGRSAHWNGEALLIRPSEATKRNIPRADTLEDYWRTYFASIFNPARLKIAAMQREMPKKYWQNLPEAPLIAPLIAGAGRRMEQMIDQPATTSRKRRPATQEEPAMDLTEQAHSIDALRQRAKSCKACPLWEHATQTVFGAGPEHAPLMLVGEQPGDQEDLAGEPFVGPAGEMLSRALAQAGIDRATAYVTNAVKHFKFEPRGKRRLHQKPHASEINACRFWLEDERLLVQPRVIVALGATAAQSVLGRPVKLMQERGKPMAGANGEAVLLTVHPSYLLRLPDQRTKDTQYAEFIRDLKTAAALLAV